MVHQDASSSCHRAASLLALLTVAACIVVGVPSLLPTEQQHGAKKSDGGQDELPSASGNPATVQESGPLPAASRMALLAAVEAGTNVPPMPEHVSVNSSILRRHPLFAVAGDACRRPPGDRGPIERYRWDVLLRTQVYPTDQEVYDYFRNVLLVVQMSPSRYHLIEEVREHYRPFFRRMYFCGPRPNHTFSIPIHGYAMGWGNAQHRGTYRILQLFLQREAARHRQGASAAATDRSPGQPPPLVGDEVFDEPLEGVLQTSDDMILQPWAMLGFDKTVAWAPRLGIGNIHSQRRVRSVSSVEEEFKANWPHFRKNRPRLKTVFAEAGGAGGGLVKGLIRAALNTSDADFKSSWYASKLRGEAHYSAAAFFAVIDAFYVPWCSAQLVADRMQLMAKHWVMTEVAIPTVLRSVTPWYEPLLIQYYWRISDAAQCPHNAWSGVATGFHRCRHDHPFPRALFSTDANRSDIINAIAGNKTSPSARRRNRKVR